MELWDLYDEHENPLHKTHVRGQMLAQGEYHLVIHIWTFSKGKLLVTQRHPDKPYPLKWEVTGGSVLAKETALAGACRELFEETGIQCYPEDLKLAVTKIEGNAIYKSYILVKKIDPDVIRCQENETVDAKFVSRMEWCQMIKADKVAEPIEAHYFAYQKELDAYFDQKEEA